MHNSMDSSDIITSVYSKEAVDLKLSSKGSSGSSSGTTDRDARSV